MKLIVGLGNPGKEYQNTRHNFGFMAIDHAINGKYKLQTKNKYEYAKEIIAGETVIFLKPLSYMNLSGSAVSEIINFYKIDIKDVLIIFDDLDSDFGKIKLKTNSSSGGHNGVKDIINKLGTKDFARIKLGINNEYKRDVKSFVLSKFSKSETGEINEILNTVDEIINDFINGINITELMNKYN